jgi:transaldolase
MQAYLLGLEQAREQGLDLSTIASVASFFVSRVDTETDARLDAIGTDEAIALKGQAGIANARLAYHAWTEVFSTPRWRVLADEGARPQRPLWASTGVKSPDYSPTMYVDQLVAASVVNTMPAKTLDAVQSSATITGDTITGTEHEADDLLDRLEELGISYTEVTDLLEVEGVDKFNVSWAQLQATVSEELERAAG